MGNEYKIIHITHSAPSSGRLSADDMAAEEAGDGGDGGDGPGEDGDYCDSHRVSLRRGRLLPASIEWTVKPIKNSECVHIVSRDKPYGCLRYLSANADCGRRHLRLAKRDDGSACNAGNLSGWTKDSV